MCRSTFPSRLAIRAKLAARPCAKSSIHWRALTIAIRSASRRLALIGVLCAGTWMMPLTAAGTGLVQGTAIVVTLAVGRPAEVFTGSCACVGRELSFYRLEQRGIENGLVLTVVNLATVDHLADIEAVLEQIRERPHAEAAPADGPAGRAPPRLAANSPPIEVLRQRADGAELEITGKDCANRRSLGWYHEDLLSTAA